MSDQVRHPDTELLFLTIKRVLKARGITYKDLSLRMETSEAAVKNIFHQRAISLDKLAHLCDKIGLSIGELVSASGLYQGGVFELSDEHERFFVDNPDHFDFFRELILHKKNLKQIAKEHSLDRTSVFKYARQLEKMGFIELINNTSVRRLVKGRLEWRVGGPWQQKNLTREVSEITQRALDSFNDPEVLLSTGAFSLSPDKLRRFYEDIGRLVSEYKAIAQKQLEVKSEEERQSEVFINWSIIAAPGPHPSRRKKISSLK